MLYDALERRARKPEAEAACSLSADASARALSRVRTTW